MDKVVVVKIIIGIVAFLIVRDIAAWFFGWGNGETFVDLMENAAHHRKIHNEWVENGRPIVESTVGWRPDPWNKNDGYRKDPPGEHYVESYSRLIRGGTKEYQERFARDVEESRHE